MSRHKLSDDATEACWDFTQDERLMSLLGGQARELAGKYGVDADDVLQETYLWLAVRPDLQARGHAMVLGQTRAVAHKMFERENRRDHVEYPEDLGDD